MKHTFGFLIAVGLLVFGIHSAFAADTSTQSPSRGSQQSAVGTIDKITDDKITVKTEDGKTRSFTIDKAQRDLIKSQALKEGDRIDLALNKQNQVVGVNKSNELGSPNPGSNTVPGGTPDSGMNPNSGTNNGMGGSNPNQGMGGTGSNPNPNPEPGTGGGMSGGPNTGGSGSGMGGSGGAR